MVLNIQIYNNVIFHYEIIETIINIYNYILNIDKNIPVQLYIHHKHDHSFYDYIKKKYPKILFKNIHNNYDFFINCTIYDSDYNKIDKHISNKKYISHDITDRLMKNPNVFFLSPIATKNVISAHILPFSNNMNINNRYNSIPIYIIQGNLNHNRRNLNLLKKILDFNYQHKFMIKMIGLGNFPSELNKYKKKIIVKCNLNFQDFHKEFLDAYCILPLISIKSHKHYYTKKLTSSINYAKAYQLKCFIDKPLQNIYKLNNVEVYDDDDDDDIYNKFNKTLIEFYDIKKSK